MVSMWLRRDTPADYIEELHYHVGLTEQRPATLELDDCAIFCGGGEDYLPGGTVASLRLGQPYSNRDPVWGLHVRRFVGDDEWVHLLVCVVPKLATWSATRGWIGFVRDEFDLDVWLNFYAVDGHTYACRPGEAPQPIAKDAPPFPARTRTAFDL
jgi:hypothetical protein